MSVLLTKEARKLVNERWRQVDACYQQDLAKTWQKIHQSITDMATTHHKSIHRVQTEFHMGRSVQHTQ